MQAKSFFARTKRFFLLLQMESTAQNHYSVFFGRRLMSQMLTPFAKLEKQKHLWIAGLYKVEEREKANNKQPQSQPNVSQAASQRDCSFFDRSQINSQPIGNLLCGSVLWLSFWAIVFRVVYSWQARPKWSKRFNRKYHIEWACLFLLSFTFQRTIMTNVDLNLPSFGPCFDRVHQYILVFLLILTKEQWNIRTQASSFPSSPELSPLKEKLLSQWMLASCGSYDTLSPKGQMPYCTNRHLLS